MRIGPLFVLAVLLPFTAFPVAAQASCSQVYLYPPDYSFQASCPGASEVVLAANDILGQPLLQVCDQNSGLCVSGCGSVALFGTDAIDVLVVPFFVDQATGSVCIGSTGSVHVHFS